MVFFSFTKYLASLRSMMSRGRRGGRDAGGECRRRGGAVCGPLTLERLEDRISPAHAMLQHGLLRVDQVSAGDVITIRLRPGDPTRLEVLDLGVPVQGSPVAVSAVTQITVNSGSGPDTLVIDATNGSPVPSGGISYDGGGGAGGTLVAPSGPDTWNITGANSGTLNGLISFTRTPNLIGGNAADAFQFSSGGSVSGVINGGTGPLSLDAGSGTLNILNNVVSAGGGDLSFTGGTITVNPGATISTGPDGGTAGNATFAAHTSAGTGSISLAGNVFTHGKNLTVLADAAIVLNTQSGPVTLSTRQIGAGTSPATSPSTGDSGTIAFTGTSITLGSPQNGAATAGLFTQTGTGSPFKAGDINLTVSQKAGALFPQFVDLASSTVEITANHATLIGGTVTLLADAEHSHVFDLPSQTPFQTTVQTAISQFQNITLIGGVAVSSADAEISLGQGSSIQANTFNAVAFALTDAESKPITAVQGGVAVAVVNSKATVTVAGSITTTGDAFIQSRTDNTVLAVGDAFGNILGVTPAVAVGIENAQATTHIASSAILNVGGNLNVLANTDNRKALLARTATGSDGRLGVAVAVDSTKDDTSALVDGSVTVGGDATIQAAETKDGVDTTKFFLPTFFAGVAADAGVNTSTTGDFLTDQQNALVTTLIGKVSNLVKAASDAQQQVGQVTQGETSKFQLAAAVADDYETNNVTARIGDSTTPTPAVVKDAGNLTVDARIDDRPVVIAGSNTNGSTNPPATPSPDPTKFSGSVAVALGTYNNTATSFINTGSVVDAGKNLAVTSEALNDYQFAYGVNLYQAATQKPTHTTDEPGASSVVINPGDIVEVKDGHTGGGTVGDWYQYTPLVPATLDLTSDDFTNTARWLDLGPGWEVKTQGFVQNFTTYLDNSFGADANLADTWSQATTAGAQEAVAGSFTNLTLNQTSNAYIAPGARVNQDPTLRTGGQNVSVVATAINSSVDLGGSVQTPGIQGNGTDFSIDPQKPGAGTQAGKKAVGAAFVVVNYNDTVTATINNGVKLYADSLDVDAENAVSNVSVMISGQKSGDEGFNAAFSEVNVADKTIAQVDNGARVVVGSAPLSAADPVSAEVHANDVTHLYNLVGGITISKNRGVGASVALDQVNRDTEALVGDYSSTALVGDKPTGADKTLSANGALDVSADNGGFVRSLSLAGAVATASPLDNTSLVRILLRRGGESGVGVAADVSDNQVSDTTLAYVHDAVVGATAANVSATNDTEIQAVSGAAAIVAKVTGSSRGLAGSYAQNTLGGTTNAFVDNSNLTLTGGLTVAATTIGEIFAISASGSVAPTSTGTSGSLAGQLSENDLGTTTEADAANQSVVSAGSVSLSAQDTDSIFAVAGALAFGGKSGLGTAVSLNNLPGSGQGQTVRADLRNSDLHVTGQTQLDAEAHEGIRAITAAVGAGVTGMAAATAVSVNTISPDTEAFVTGALAQGVQGGGNLSLTAADTSTLQADAGGAGLTGGSAGLGVSFALNTITGGATAEVLGAPVVLAAGALDEKASAAPNIEATAVGGGASAADSGHTAIDAGFGLGLNTITMGVLATVDGATVRSTGLDVEADSAARVTVLALGAGGALSIADSSSKALVGAGAGSSNTIQDTVEASLRGGSTVTTSSGAVTLGAQDASQITADAGGFALTAAGGKGGGTALSVGASVAVNSITNSVQALIDPATVSGGGGVDLSALETATIQALTIAGSAAVAAGQGGTKTFAGAGAGSGNTINDTTSALVTSGSSVGSGAGQAVQLTAADESTITANAGGVSLSASVGSGKGISGAVGASAAVNTINNAVTAAVDGSTVRSGGAVDLEAAEAAQISVLALGAAGSLSGGVGSIGVDGAGSASVNNITDATEASIRDNSTVASGAGYGVTVHAADDSAIAAESGSGALTVAGSIINSAISADLGFSLAINTVANTVTAAVADSSVASGGGLDLGATADEQIESVTAAAAVAASVGSAKALSFAGAGAVSVNVVGNTVTAHLSGGSHVASAGNHAVDLTAADDSSINANAGALAFSAAAGESGGTAAIGAAAAANFISNTVSAFVDNSTVTAGGDVALSATAAATVVVVTVGVSGAMTASGAGSASTNTTRNKVMAGVTGRSSVTAGGQVKVKAEDDSSITAAAGAGALSIVGGSGTKVGVGLSFSIAVNDILDSATAVIDSSTVSGASGVSLDATTAASIDAVTVAGSLAGAFGAGANLAFVGVGAGSINTIADTTEARITGGGVTATTGAVQVHAADDASIEADAGAVDVAAGGGSGVAGALAVGASFAVNTITDTTQALLDGAAVAAGGAVDVGATSGADVLAITVGFSAAVGIGGGTSVGVAGFGSFSANTVADTTTAAVENGSRVVTSGGGDVGVRADDDAVIRAVAGAGALAIAGGGGVSVSGVLGLSVAVNTVSNGASAFIDSSTVAASGNVFDEATSAAEIDSVTVAGTAAGSFSAGVGLAFAGAGAASVNTISNTTEARISGGAAVNAGDGGLLRVHAEDDARIKADAGALTVGVSAGAVLRGVGAFGASFAADTITDTARATIDGATASSGGGVEVSGASGAHVFTVAVGAAGGVAIGSIGVALAGAGSVSANTVSDTVEASVKDGSRVASANGGAVTVSATDGTAITAAGGAGVLVAAGGPGGGIGLGLGFSVAVNTVTDSARAVVEDATVYGSGGVLVTATSTADIEAVTAAGVGVGTGGSVGGLSFAGAGAGSGNTINDTTEAHLARSIVSTDSARTVQVLAADNATIQASAGAVGIAIAGGGGGGGTASAGASMAVNTITDTTRATVDSSAVTSGGLDVEATSGGSILTAAVGASGALGIAGGGGVALTGAAAGTGNTITNTLEASVKDGSRVNAGNGAIVLRAIDGASVEAVAGSAALAGAGGATIGISAAIGIGLSANSIADTVTAFIDAAAVTGGRVEVSASSEAAITTLSFGGSGAIGGAGIVGGALAGAGAGSGNTIADVITATVSGGSVVRATTGDVKIMATDHSSIDAGAGAGAFAVAGAGVVAVGIAIGASVLVNDVGNTVQASIDHATVSAAGDVSLTAHSTASVRSLAVDSALGAAGAKIASVAVAAAGAASTNTIHDNILAFVQDSAQVSASGNVALTAADESSIDSEAGGGSVGIGGSIAGFAGSVSLVAAVNRIHNTVLAYVGAGGGDATAVTAAGDVSLSADSTASIRALAQAASVGVEIAIGGSVTVAGADAFNSVADNIGAFLQGGVTANAAGGLQASAKDAASVQSLVVTEAFGLGLVGGSIGVSLTQNLIDDAITASLGSASVNTQGHDVTVSALSLAQISAQVVGTSQTIAIGFDGNGCEADSRDDSVTEAFVGDQARLNLTGGALHVTSSSGSTLSSEADGGALGIVAIGHNYATAEAEGATLAFIGGDVTLNAAEVDVTAEGDDRADAKNFLVAVSLVGVDAANVSADTSGTVAAFVGDGSTLSLPGGLLRVKAVSSPTAKAESDGVAGGFINVSILNTNATVGGSTLAFIGQGDNVTAGALEVTAESPNCGAEADSFDVGIGIIASGAGSHTTAKTGRDVEAFVGPHAGDPLLSPTTLNVAGAVTVQAADFDLNNPDGTATQARVDATVGSGGFITAAAAVSDAVIDGTTTAYLGDGVAVRGGSLTVHATGVDEATDTALVGSGGGFAGNGTDTRADVTPTISAYLGNGDFVAVSGGVDVEAVSVHAEGHTRAESFGGGGLFLGIPEATTSTGAVVTADLGRGTVVLAGGDVTVRAAAHSDPTGTFNDQIQSVDPARGTITFPSHGLLDGDYVRYVPAGSATPLQTPLGPLDPSRAYRVIVVTPSTVKLGASFSADPLQVLASLMNVTDDPIDPLNPTSGVYAGGDAIKFSGPSGFQTGDAVVYEANLKPTIGGLTDGGTYYVRAIDPYTVKLYPTQAAAETAYQSFDPSSAVSGSTFQFNPGFQNGDAVTYLAPTPATFRSTDVVNSNFLFQPTSFINLASAAGFAPGDLVVYETNDTKTSPIGGLVNGQVYEVYSVFGSAVQLADPSTGLPILLDPDLSSEGRSATEELRQLPIGGLQDGHTYYVTNATGGSFMLAGTLQDAMQGNALSLGTSGRSGTHQIGLDGIALTPGQGTQDLRLALVGPATNGPTGDELLSADGQSLRAINPPAGGGQSSAIAEGGSGAGVADLAFPNASLSMDPTVKSYVAASQVSAGGNVTIAAESFGNIESSANNAGGGIIYVSTANATARFGEAGTPNTSQAFVGTEDPSGAVDATGVQIQAGGAFTLSSESALHADISSEADGGGFLSFTEADSTLDVTSNTDSVVGSNAVIAARRVAITADVSTLHAHTRSNSDTGSVIGFANAFSNSNVKSKVDVHIGGSARISGFEGVDVVAKSEQFGAGLDPTAHSFIVFLGIPIDTHIALPSSDDHFHTTIEAEPGATILAGPRPPDSPLQAVPGYDSLALFVQAADDNLKDGSEDRTVTWQANVSILSGPAPELVVDENGNIVRAVNVSVSDGGVNKTSGQIVGNVVDVNPITGGPGGQVLMQADDQIMGGPVTPLFDFVDNYDHVRIINLSAKDLVVSGIDVINRGSPPLVNLDTPNLDSSFGFNITHTVSPTLVDVENDDSRQRPSSLILAGPIENPIGTTRIVNARGDVLSGGRSDVVRTESLDVEASGSIGTLSSRIDAELVESVDQATGALRPAILTASAGTGSVDLSLTGRRRDNLTTPFTLTINTLTAGGNVDVSINDSVQDPGAAGQVGGVIVDAPQQGITDNYFVHFQPDGDPAQRAGLDPGVFADMADAVPISSVYDMGIVAAGNNVSIQAGSATTVDLVLGNVTAPNTVFIANTGTITDLVGADNFNVTAFEFDVRAVGGIGTPADPLETAVRRLHVLAGNGDLWINNPGAMELATIDVSLTRPSVLHAGSIDTMTIGPDMLVPGDDLAGQLIVDATLGSLRVAGGTPGTIVAGHVGIVRTYGGYGPLVLQIKENGIQRRVEAAVPGMDFPIPPPPPAPIPPTSPAGVLFQYVYESGSLANPQLTVRVANSASTAPDQFDLSLVTWNDAAKFNLARLDSAGVSGIRNVAVEGDVLTAVTPQAAAFFQVPGPSGTALDATPAGIRLPLDNLAGVGVRDFLPNSSIQAASIQAVAFGSHVEENGPIETGSASRGEDAADTLVAATAIVQAHDTYRVPFADLPSQQVGLFLATAVGGGRFDDESIDFVVQGVSSPNAAGTANVVTPSNAPRGAVVALVTAAPTTDNQGRPADSVVQSIRMRGDGASISSGQYIASSITSTGPLGDLVLGSHQGITDVTAPSIFGSIASDGPITGTVQTTGLRTDPITGVTSQVPADLGRLYVDTTHPQDPFVTATVVQSDGITGRLVSRGDLISQVDGDVSGVIAAQGNIGKTFTYASGQSLRLGGIDADQVSGDIVSLGTILADIDIGGGLRGGRIAAKKGIAGNLTINGDLDSAAAIVSGGEIGDPALGTQLTLHGDNRGFIAADGVIHNAASLAGIVFNNVAATPDNPNAAAIDAVFTEMGQPLSFDINGVYLAGLDDILHNLALLRVGSGGNLTGTTP
jgi:hypothetical protein